MMRVVFNLLTTLKPKTGVGQYAARLFGALGRELPAGSLDGFPTGRLAKLVERLHQVRPGRPPRGRSRAVAGLGKRIVRSTVDAGLALAFDRVSRRNQYDLYHEPNFVPFAIDLPTIVTVHDLSVVLHPEWHPAERVRHHERRFRKGLAVARHVFTDTLAVRDEVVKHLGVAPARVTAVHLGVGQEYLAASHRKAAQVRQELGLPERYLLFVGTIEPRKNVITLLRAFCDLPAVLRCGCPLVLAGGWGWKSTEVAELLQTSGRDRGVIHLGYTADRYLPGLYAGATALVYPSHYEGFGLPPLEMLATGGAVISSTATSLREVLDSHAHFVEPLDIAGWRDALARAITDDAWLAGLRHGGRERAAQFTWERCAAATAGVYHSVLASVRDAA
jgi:alpha-1,3-rhamnosyl/mannosyltransferase